MHTAIRTGICTPFALSILMLYAPDHRCLWCSNDSSSVMVARVPPYSNCSKQRLCSVEAKKKAEIKHMLDACWHADQKGTPGVQSYRQSLFTLRFPSARGASVYHLHTRKLAIFENLHHGVRVYIADGRSVRSPARAAALRNSFQGVWSCSPASPPSGNPQDNSSGGAVRVFRQQQRPGEARRPGGSCP